MRIDTRLAERLKNIRPSPTLAITAKAKKLRSEGRDIINLAAGEPDFDTPDFIKEAAISAIKEGFTKYTPTTGIPELKELICRKLKKDNSLDYNPSQVIVSCGAKHSIFNAILALANRDDEILIPSPYWVSYPEMVSLCEAKPCFIKTSSQNNFKIKAGDLERQVHPKTKALILNSPSNPTGSVYSLGELEEIARICVAKRIFVISDEIYEKLIYDGLKHTSIASLNKNIYGLTLTINGLSKSYAMTGWRIGYLAGPQNIIDRISNLQDHSTSNPASISQKAAVAALKATDDFSNQLRQEFQKRKDYLVSRLKKLKKISFIPPQGAFYVFCNIAQLNLDSLSLANRLLEEASVSVIPGEGFGRDDYIRLSFAASIEHIAEGMARIKRWLNSYGS